MFRRPRCRTCAKRIWPWQASGGWAVMGAKDSDRELSFMQHIGCLERNIEARRANRENYQNTDW